MISMATPQNMKRERSKGFKPVKSFNRCAQFKPFKGLTTVQSSRFKSSTTELGVQTVQEQPIAVSIDEKNFLSNSCPVSWKTAPEFQRI
jgi:hypothetical protein